MREEPIPADGDVVSPVERFRYDGGGELLDDERKTEDTKAGKDNATYVIDERDLVSLHLLLGRRLDPKLVLAPPVDLTRHCFPYDGIEHGV